MRIATMLNSHYMGDYITPAEFDLTKPDSKLRWWSSGLNGDRVAVAAE